MVAGDHSLLSWHVTSIVGTKLLPSANSLPKTAHEYLERQGYFLAESFLECVILVSKILPPIIIVKYPKILNKGRTSNNMCAPLFWRKKRNGKLKGAHQIKSARTLFEMRPLIGTLGCAL